MSRARFAYRIRITRFREFVLLGKLDGDYASPYPQYSFPAVFENRPIAENVFLAPYVAAPDRSIATSDGIEIIANNKKGKTYQTVHLPLGDKPQRSEIKYSRVWGDGIPIEIAG